jgi:uncharacterized membrane protein YoaK (UPF0700 family)
MSLFHLLCRIATGCIAAIMCASAYAEGIALGNPLGGPGGSLLFLFPLGSTFVLAMLMFAEEHLRKYLWRAVAVSVVMLLLIVAVGAAWNLLAVLIGVFLFPWVALVVFLCCYIVGYNRHLPRSPDVSSSSET